MAQVPRGCRSCVDANVQARTFKFRDQGPVLHEKYRSTPQSASCAVDSQKNVAPSTSGRLNAQYKPIAFPIDGTVSPSLSVTAISSLQVQVFTNFVLSTFPCYFKSTETQVPVNWVEYVVGRRVTNSCFDWAIRACTTSYAGAVHNDQRCLDESRVLYIRSLQGLAGLLSDVSTAKSDEALAAAVVLAIYEKHHCTDADSWLKHASGIRTLMKLRGPEAHLHGFGRAMYIAYRSFLVTAALIAGEECFLQEPEWQALNKQIAAENAKLPDSSLYTDVVDRGFLEIMKIPGHVKRVRELPSLPPRDWARVQPVLLQSVHATRAALRGIHTDLGVSVAMHRTGKCARPNFIGPLSNFFDGSSSLFESGVRSGLMILNHLVSFMNPTQQAMVESESLILSKGTSKGPASPESDVNSPVTPPDSPKQTRLVVQSLITPAHRKPPTTDWMDHVAMTMGMDGVRVSILE
ncbi:hypothetical protein BBP40_005641 [Aspergillus hancockii]|nr:hypothetical protein BBP40_005641 [Aspergillus hancockii]